nr:hypothetical protein [uncultured Anaerostipes sp.]
MLLFSMRKGEYKKNSCTDPSANRVVSDTAPKGKLNAGDIIYWHTLSGDGKRRWNHVGTLKEADSSHPNHS